MQYYIYHIPGVKIGCTKDLKLRMQQQGFTEWEILETHTDVYEASKREIQLQKEYGLPVDQIPYYLTLQHQKPITRQAQSAGGNVSSTWLRKLEFKDAEVIRALCNSGSTQRQVAKMYNVSQRTITNIVNNLTYTE